jgi:tetratricopeptide (TPR) repeat protein
VAAFYGEERDESCAGADPCATARATDDIAPAAIEVASGSDSRPRDTLAQGVVLAERYRIVRLLGQGAMGSVYEAIDQARSGLRVAVKLLAVHEPHALYRLKNEFRALSETVHPNLVGLHGLVADARGWFVVMDLVDARHNFLNYVRSGEANVTDRARLYSALVQLVDGVAAIHAAGKLHRDLKPSNVLITPEGRVVIADFGLVVDQEKGGVGRTQERSFVGTPAYAAPEQVDGEKVSTKSDLYSVGVLLFEALTGRLPIEDESVQRLLARKQCEDAPDPGLLADAPEDLRALCIALLQRDPALRPSAREVLGRLDCTPLAEPMPSALPFVGRKRELRQLEHAAARVVAGGGSQLVLVTGVSGIGKTALLTRFLDDKRREAGTVVLRSRCNAQEQVPFNAFDTLIEALGRHLSQLDALDAARLMPRDVALLARQFPTLLRVPAVLQMPMTTRQELDPALLRTRAFAALKELLARLADHMLLLVCFDDLQWCDEDSVELMRELLREPGAPACLFLCALRGTEPSDQRVVECVRSLPERARCEFALPPLDLSASTELARAVLGGDTASTGRRADSRASTRDELGLVLSEAAGSPFVLKELARGARRRGHVLSLQETVAMSCAELSTETRTLVELVCVAGQPLALELALRTAGAGPEALSAALISSLVRTGRVYGSEHLESAHDRIRAAVLATLDDPRRVLLHRMLAHALSASPDGDPERIAKHLRAAGLSELAAPYTLRAAECAREALAFGRAVELYETALAESDAFESAGVELALADSYASIGKLSDAGARYERVLRRCTDGARRRGLGIKAMLLYLLAGQTERGALLCDELSRELGIRPYPQNPVLALAVLTWLSLRYLLAPRASALPVPTENTLRELAEQRIDLCTSASRGLLRARPEQSVYYGMRMLLAARKERHPRSWPLLLAGEAMLRCIPRGVSTDRELLVMERALALAEADGDAETLAAVLMAKGSCDLFTCRLRQAVDAFEDAEAVLLSCDRAFIRDFNDARNGRLTTWLVMGEYRELFRHCDTRLMEARALGDRFGELTSRLIGAHRFLARDEPHEAERALAYLADASKEVPRFAADPWWRGEVALYQEDSQAALAAYEHARRASSFRYMQKMSGHRSYSAHILARACLMEARQGKRVKERLRQAERVARSLAREGFPLGPAAAKLIFGAVAALRGDDERAAHELERAADIYARCGALLHATAARHRASLLRGGTNAHSEAARATATARELGVHNPERWFRTFLAGFPDY